MSILSCSWSITVLEFTSLFLSNLFCQWYIILLVLKLVHLVQHTLLFSFLVSFRSPFQSPAHPWLISGLSKKVLIQFHWKFLNRLRLWFMTWPHRPRRVKIDFLGITFKSNEIDMVGRFIYLLLQMVHNFRNLYVIQNIIRKRTIWK